MKEKINGVITLEACISVLSFLILMLLLSSLFVMFMAQNLTSHALLETAESLSLDVYSNSRIAIKDGHIGSVGDYLAQLFKKLTGSAETNPYFVTDDRWYEKESDVVAETVKTRFIGYVAGGGSSAIADADKQLKALNVVNGMDGLDFSKSCVKDDVLYITLEYELEYDFNIWSVKNVPVTQTVCAKLWK